VAPSRRRPAASAPPALEALAAIAAAAARSPDLASALRDTLATVCRATDLAGGAVYRRAGDGRLELLAAEGRAPRPPAPRGRRGADLALPIPVDGQPWGLLVLAGPRRGRPAPAAAFLAAVAGQVGVAVSRARLLAEAQEQSRRLEALSRLARTLTAALPMGDILEAVCATALGFFPGDAVQVWILEGEHLISRAQRGFRTSQAAEQPGPLPLGQGLAGEAASARRPAYAADVARDARVVYPAWMREEGLVSVVALPLLARDRLVGALAVLTRAPHVFSPSEMELLLALADQAAVAVDNAQLVVFAQQRAAEYRALYEVGKLVGATLDAERVVDLIAERCREVLGVGMAGVFRLDADAGLLVYERGLGLSADFVRRLRVRLGEGSSGRAASERRPVWSRDVLDDPAIPLSDRVRELVEREGYRGVLSVPILTRGELWGALAVYWLQPHAPSPTEIELLSGLAVQAGLAMENAELMRQTQARLQETEMLLAVSRTLASSLDAEAMPRQFLRQVCRALSADTAGIWLLPEGGELVQGLLGYDVPRDKLSRFQALRLSVREHDFLAESLRTRRPVFAPEAASDPRLPPELRAMDARWSFLWVPMVTADRVAGGFAVAWWGRVHRLSPSELHAMEAVTTQVGVALENARLFRDHERRVHELSVLHELARAVTGQLDRAQLVDTLGRQLARVFETQDMTILLADGDAGAMTVALRVRSGVPDEQPPRRYPPGGAGLASGVLASGQPIRTDDYAGRCAERGLPPLPVADGMPHWLGVPMRAGGARLGVICLRSAGRAFTEADERLLANVADMAALALSSARLFEERSRAYSDLARAQEQLVLTERLRALGEMASGVAHDFNNLLASILGRAQLVLEEIEDGKLRRWVQIIERAALDGARTVRRLQEFTRIRRDQPFVPVSLNRVVEEALEVTEARWRDEPRSRGVAVDVTVALASALPPVAGDPAELREVLTNLVLNAIDAMPEGGRLRLATREVDGAVELRVVDTGSGMTEAVRQRIFDPFFTTKGPRGTGLGLSIAYGILSRHGAAVEVESAEGRGTTFILRFPATAPAPEARPEPPAARPGGPLRCLVVDDEDVVGDVLGDMLQAAGHQAVVTRSGAQALARFRAEPFDVVFSDLAMPGLSGWDVAREVKGLRPEVPVFMVTGFGVEVPPERMREAGLDGLLTKPLRIEQLRELLGRLGAAGTG
jgi:GAF domain-containing protein/anti-sigma regulatory factor (Ser/Thr protein kinase)